MHNDSISMSALSTSTGEARDGPCRWDLVHVVSQMAEAAENGAIELEEFQDYVGKLAPHLFAEEILVMALTNQVAQDTFAKAGLHPPEVHQESISDGSHPMVSKIVHSSSGFGRTAQLVSEREWAASNQKSSSNEKDQKERSLQTELDMAERNVQLMREKRDLERRLEEERKRRAKVEADNAMEQAKRKVENDAFQKVLAAVHQIDEVNQKDSKNSIDLDAPSSSDSEFGAPGATGEITQEELMVKCNALKKQNKKLRRHAGNVEADIVNAQEEYASIRGQIGGDAKISEFAWRSKAIHSVIQQRLDKNKKKKNPKQHDIVYHHAGLERLLRMGKHKIKPTFDRLVHTLAKRFNASPLTVPIKGKERSRTKVQVSYGGDASQLTDVVRATLSFKMSPNVLSLIYDALEAMANMDELRSHRISIVKFKDRFLDPLSGYMDMTILMKIDGFVCELQLNIDAVLRVKNSKVGHGKYEKDRMVNDDLLYATMCNEVEDVEEALDNGADPNSSRDMYGLAALHYAAQHGNPAMVAMLLKSGASVFMTDQEHKLPIYRAVLHAHVDVVKSLLHEMDAAFSEGTAGDASSMVALAACALEQLHEGQSLSAAEVTSIVQWCAEHMPSNQGSLWYHFANEGYVLAFQSLQHLCNNHDAIQRYVGPLDETSIEVDEAIPGSSTPFKLKMATIDVAIRSQSTIIVEALLDLGHTPAAPFYIDDCSPDLQSLLRRHQNSNISLCSRSLVTTGTAADLEHKARKAAKVGDLRTLQALFLAGVDMGRVGLQDHLTAFQLAIRGGHVDCVRFLQDINMGGLEDSLLDRNNPEFRLAAVETIGYLATLDGLQSTLESAMPHFMQNLCTDEQQIREAVGSALWKFSETVNPNLLAKHLRQAFKNDRKEIRSSAVNACSILIVKTLHQNLMQLLAEQLADDESSVASLAFDALVRISAKIHSIAPKVAVLMRPSMAQHVRALAVRALGYLQDAAHPFALQIVDCIADDDGQVRNGAMESLKQLKHKETAALQKLSSYLSHSVKPEVCTAVIQVFVAMGATPSLYIDQLVELLSHDDSKVVDSVVAAFEIFSEGKEMIAQAVAKQIDEMPPDKVTFRLAAMRAFAAAGRCVEPFAGVIAKQLASDDDRIRHVAASLGKHLFSVVEAVVHHLESAEANVRIAALSVLWDLGVRVASYAPQVASQLCHEDFNVRSSAWAVLSRMGNCLAGIRPHMGSCLVDKKTHTLHVHGSLKFVSEVFEANSVELADMTDDLSELLDAQESTAACFAAILATCLGESRKTITKKFFNQHWASVRETGWLHEPSQGGRTGGPGMAPGLMPPGPNPAYLNRPGAAPPAPRVIPAAHPVRLNLDLVRRALLVSLDNDAHEILLAWLKDPSARDDAIGEFGLMGEAAVPHLSSIAKGCGNVPDEDPLQMVAAHYLRPPRASASPFAFLLLLLPQVQSVQPDIQEQLIKILLADILRSPMSRTALSLFGAALCPHLPRVIECIKTETEEIAMDLIRVLNMLGEVAGPVAPLVFDLIRTHEERRAFGMAAMRHMGQAAKDFVEQMVEFITDSNVNVCKEACATLQALGMHCGVCAPRLLAFLAHKENHVRLIACSIFRCLPRNATSRFISNFVAEIGSRYFQESALAVPQNLWCLDHGLNAEDLNGLICHKEQEVRTAALSSLQRSAENFATVAPQLLTCFTDRQQDAWATVVRNLVHVEDASVFLSTLSNSDFSAMPVERRIVIMFMVTTLGYNVKSFLPHIGDLITDKKMRAEAVCILATSRHLAATFVKELVKCLSDVDIKVSAWAAIALGELSDISSTFMTDLVDLLHQEDRCALILKLLCKLGEHASRAAPDILRCLSSPKDIIRGNALRALGVMKHVAKPFANEIAMLLLDSAVGVRMEAARTLHRLDVDHDGVLRMIAGFLYSSAPWQREIAFSTILGLRSGLQHYLKELIAHATCDEYLDREGLAKICWLGAHASDEVGRQVADGISILFNHPKRRVAATAMKATVYLGRHTSHIMSKLVTALAFVEVDVFQSPAHGSGIPAPYPARGQNRNVTAALVLRLLGPKMPTSVEVIQHVVGLLSHAKTEVRLCAISTLPAWPEHARLYLNQLVEMLEDPDLIVCRSSLRCLMHLKHLAHDFTDAVSKLLKNPHLYGDAAITLAHCEVGKPFASQMVSMSKLRPLSDSDFRMGHGTSATPQVEKCLKALQTIFQADMSEERLRILQQVLWRTQANNDLFMVKFYEVLGCAGDFAKPYLGLLESHFVASAANIAHVVNHDGIPQLLGKLGQADRLAKLLSTHPLRDDAKLRVLNALGKCGPAAKPHAECIADHLHLDNDNLVVAAVVALGRLGLAAPAFREQAQTVLYHKNKKVRDVTAATMWVSGIPCQRFFPRGILVCLGIGRVVDRKIIHTSHAEPHDSAQQHMCNEALQEIMEGCFHFRNKSVVQLCGEEEKTLYYEDGKTTRWETLPQATTEQLNGVYGVQRSQFFEQRKEGPIDILETSTMSRMPLASNNAGFEGHVFCMMNTSNTLLCSCVSVSPVFPEIIAKRLLKECVELAEDDAKPRHSGDDTTVSTLGSKMTRLLEEYNSGSKVGVEDLPDADSVQLYGVPEQIGGIASLLQKPKGQTAQYGPAQPPLSKLDEELAAWQRKGDSWAQAIPLICTPNSFVDECSMPGSFPPGYGLALPATGPL